MKVIVLVLCSSFAVIASVGRVPEAALRIASSKTDSELLVKEDEYPYVVKITRTEFWGLREKVCTGSVIDKGWVLTASRCLHSLLGGIIWGKNVEVLYNSTKLSDGVTVTATAYKKKWLDSKPYDIALLKLHRPVNVAPVELPKRDEYLNVGDDVVALGWGTFYHYGQGAGEPNESETNPKNLRKVDLQVKDLKECKPMVLSDLICAGSIEETICPGDKGGPLVRGNILFGIAYSHNHQPKCGGAALFTPVTPYLDWIEETMYNN